jgi:hypothetical protein
MFTPRFLLLRALAAATMLAFCGAVAATTLAHLSIEQMTAAASIVVRARCASTEARWEDGEIWTFSTFETEEAWKGIAPSILSVRLIGGHAGHLISTVPGVPRFRRGEEVILFLEATRTDDFTVTSWAQGTFRITLDPRTGLERVTQDAAGFAFLESATHQFQESGIRNLSLDELRERVEAAGRIGGSKR